MTRFELNPKMAWTTRSLSVLLAGLMLATPFSVVGQLPTNPNPVAGQVDINTQGRNMFINQHTNRAVVDFDSFSIGANHGVFVNQPGSQSALLSRVTGVDPSVVHGILQATGKPSSRKPHSARIMAMTKKCGSMIGPA